MGRSGFRKRMDEWNPFLSSLSAAFVSWSDFVWICLCYTHKKNFNFCSRFTLWCENRWQQVCVTFTAHLTPFVSRIQRYFRTRTTPEKTKRALCFCVTNMSMLSGLQLGLERFHGVGILGFNSPEWFISDIGCIFAG